MATTSINPIIERHQRMLANDPNDWTQYQTPQTKRKYHPRIPSTSAESTPDDLKRDGSFSVGYGGRYGVQSDRMDKSAMGFNYKPPIEKHSSQIDHSRGFGGKFGIEADRMDRSAVGFAHKEPTSQHPSQSDHLRADELAELKTNIKELKDMFEKSSRCEAVKHETWKHEKAKIDRDMSDIQTKLQTIYGTKKKSPSKPNFLVRMLACCGPARLGKKRD